MVVVLVATTAAAAATRYTTISSTDTHATIRTQSSVCSYIQSNANACDAT